MSGESATARESTLADLVGRREGFVSFVRSRVRDDALAEDIVQHAFAKSVDKLDELRDHESSVAWFYRLLRRAIIDHARARGAAESHLERLATELDAAPEEPLPDDRNAICQCVLGAARGLKPEYAEAIQRIDVDGVPVNEFAKEAGVTASNAGVRVFRARQALRAEVAKACGACATHGCIDCSCKH
ncbi:MAG: sigma-70 family RNA polymerase sigma factor [Polyangiaceae bacterium]